jgi:Putative peptidoglycan binding domain
MANPELRRDATETDWVEYLQGLLVARLQADSDAGSVRLSPIDGLFGPITEGSVKYFQKQNGLSETGVVDDATWQALEGAGQGAQGGAGGQGGAGQTGAKNPVDLRVPFVLEMTWDQITLEDLNKGWAQFDLSKVPKLSLKYQSPIGKLIGNGGVQLLNKEFTFWDSWFLNWSTKIVFDYAKDKGIRLGTDNHVDLGIRPMKNLTLKLEGDMNFKWAPADAKGDMYLYGGLKLEWKFDLMGKP